MKPYLNIGCGNVFHQSWENIDLVSRSRTVRQHDLTKGLPYDSGTFAAVYASHVLEHIPHEVVQDFVRECARVTRPGGVLRLVVPDFEAMSRAYIASLEQATSGDVEASSRHEWMTIEIIDQAVRLESGGAMKKYILAHRNDPVMEFIRSRVGREVSVILGNSKETCADKRCSIMGKQFYRIATQKALEAIAWLLQGNSGRKAVQQGFLRNGGEVHQWIFDRLSLQRLLEKHCMRVVQMDAFSSSIPDFITYELDTQNGHVRKPDSLYMEGIKA
jgi:predicted SAM-dependent methyltransferase